MDVEKVDLSYCSANMSTQDQYYSDATSKLKVSSARRFKKLHEYNVAVLGARQAGQTSVIKRLVQGKFVKAKHSTVLEYSCLDIQERNIRLHIFDLSGNHNEAQLQLNMEIIKKCHYALIVFSMQDLQWQQLLSNWMLQVRSLAPSCKITLFGNKCDLPCTVDRDLVNQYCSRHMVDRVIFGSAKTGEGVAEILDMEYIDNYMFARLDVRQKQKSCLA